MTLILSGTDGLSDIDGSASTPAIRGTDANTGIFFPAADTIAFSEGGAEAMRIDSSGNVGIGTSSPQRKLDVTVSDTTTAQVYLRNNNASYASGMIVYNAGGEASMFRHNGGSDTSYAGANSVNIGSITNNVVAFIENNIERARFTSGRLLVGTTGTVDLGFGTQQLTVRSTSGSAAIFDCASGVNEPAIIGITASTSGYTSNVVDLRTGMAAGTGFTFIAAAASGTTRFQVLGNGDVRNTNNSYGAISDAKLKENIVDATPKLDDLMQVRVRNYNLIGDDQKQIGVVAQELEQVFPGMVDESQDKDTDGNLTDTSTKSVKYSVFVPILIKAMQELKSELDSVKAELATLKGA